MADRIFSNVKFYLIGLKNSNVEEKLVKNGAQKHHYLSDILTHCIAGEFDDEVAEAMDLYQLKVVNTDWIDCSLKCQTPLPTKAFEIEATPSIFKGLLFHITEVNERDAGLLWGIIRMNGGRVLKKISHNITHLVTNSPHPNVSNQPTEPSIRVVISNWVVECHKRKVKLSEDGFHPRLYEVDDEGEINRDSAKEGDGGGSVGSAKAVSVRSEEVRLKTNTQKNKVFATSKEAFWLSKGIFDKCVFYVEDYRQPVGDEEMLQWRQLIRGQGGVVVDGYGNEVTHVLCPNQASHHYKQAKEDGKRLRTAYWLNDCLVSKELQPPNRFLHVPYPLSISTLLFPHRISTTNIRGYDKVLLRRVILLLGGLMTSHFNMQNTMLIFKTDDGLKMSMAKKWNIPTISLDHFYQLISAAHPFNDTAE